MTIGFLCSRTLHAQQITNVLANDSLAGCYRVSYGEWSMQENLGPALATNIIRLDTTARRPGLPGYMVAERIDPVEVLNTGDLRLKFQRPPLWLREGRDSVVIVLWSTGTESETFMGHRSGATLQGVIRRTSDAIPIDPATKKVVWNARPYASASATPMACP